MTQYKDLHSPQTLVTLLQQRAAQTPHHTAYIFLQDGEEQQIRLTYQELDHKARTIASHLLKMATPGARVLLLYPPGMEFISAFFGCLYARMVAVPAYPPDPNRLTRSLPRLNNIVEDAQAEVVLASQKIISWLKILTGKQAWQRVFRKVSSKVGIKGFAQVELAQEVWHNLRWLASERLAESESGALPEIEPQDLAFLQYTSGSTGDPKGVMLSHHNLLYNEEMICQAFGHDENTTVVGWLPLYHDMGLIGNVLQPLYIGRPCVLISPIAFLQRPLRWLAAISHYQATTSGGPNFAYDLCVRKIGDKEKQKLDLSSWKVAFNGAEPVREETMERFSQAFASCGFAKRAFYPCYGLAEASLLVSGGTPQQPYQQLYLDPQALAQGQVIVGGKEHALISCGHSFCQQKIRVVDPQTCQPVKQGQVGEIWVQGANVAGGYWQRPQLSQATFQAQIVGKEELGGFLRTGDLGFLWQEQLYITGRLKDLLIIRGRNHYPQDIERTVENSHQALRPGCCAAFAVDVAGNEEVVVVQELRRQRFSSLECEAIIREIRHEVVQSHQVQPYAVVLIEAGTIPKTSSGKIQRHACRQAFLQEQLKVVAVKVLEESQIEPLAQELSLQNLWQQPGEQQPQLLVAFLQQQLSEFGIAKENVDPEQPLIELGLDSLQVVEFQSFLEENFPVTLAGEQLLDYSLQQIASLVQEQQERAPTSIMAEPEQKPAPSCFSLSRGQRSLWFLQQFAPESAAYNLALPLKVGKKLDMARLQASLVHLQRKHILLRSYCSSDGTQWQVPDELGLPLQQKQSAAWEEATVLQDVQHEAHQPFALEQELLWRCLVYRQDQEDLLLVVAHHMIADMWSLGLWLKELLHYYETGQELFASHYDYHDFVTWQEQLLQQHQGELLNFWQKQVTAPASELLTDLPRPKEQSFHGQRLSLRWSPALANKVKQAASEHQVTPYTVLLSVFQSLIYRYTQQSKVVIGSPSLGRSQARWQKVLGHFINPLVCVASFAEKSTFAELLADNKRQLAAAWQHQDLPFATLVEKTVAERDPSRSPLFQIMFNYQNLRLEEGNLTSLLLDPEQQMDIASWQLRACQIPSEISQFDLSLVMGETEESLVGYLEYNSDLFQEQTIARLAEHLQNLAELLLTEPEQPITQLDYLSDQEKAQLWQWSQGERLPAAGDLIERVQHHTDEQPDKLALITASQRLSYQMLNSQANQLAWYLKARVPDGTRVALLLPRESELVVALLACLKANLVYLPLDPHHPRQRLEYIQKDAQVEVVITTSNYAKEKLLENSYSLLVCLDSLEQEIAGFSQENPPLEVAPEQLAYIIYTSGSTGHPKGVMISRQALSNFLQAVAERPGFSHDDTLLALTTVSFDISALEIYLPLISGGRVVLAEDNEVKIGSSLVKLLAQEQVSVLQATPATWQLLLAAGLQPATSLRKALVGGETLSSSLAKALLAHQLELWNMYGPTEATVWTSCAKITDPESISLGTPLANTECYLLDHHKQQVPIGVEGEICLGGEGLAVGYWQLSQETDRRFIAHPVYPQKRIYLTGDAARYLADGTLEFLGRKDEQVKLRGFRIELGEIAHTLLHHPQVTEAVVLLVGQGQNKKIVAYLRGSFAKISVRQLQNFLQQTLPDYMIPTEFRVGENFPLSPSGKVDRRALARGWGTVLGEQQQAESLSPQAKKLRELWQELLGVSAVSLQDNFFLLGGHSLLATQLQGRIGQVFGVHLPLREIFSYPHLQEMLERIYSRQPVVELPITHAKGKDREQLSFAQERLWFLQNFSPDDPSYNIVGAVAIEGEVDITRFQQALSQLLKRHESLQGNFVMYQGKLSCVPRQEPGFAFTYHDCSDKEQAPDWVREQIALAAHQPFDLEKHPLLRVMLFRLCSKRFVLFLNVHHIVADGWSLEIIIRELVALYQGASLPPATWQYPDFVHWQRNWLQGERLEEQIQYWQQQLAGMPEILELPNDFPRPAVRSSRGAQYRLTLEPALLAQLNQLAQQQQATLFMALLAGFQLFLARYSNQRDIPVGSVVANRSRPEWEEMVGFFANTLVLRTQVDEEQSFEDLLYQVRQTTLAAYDNQELPFEKLLEVLQPERRMSHTPLFQVMFAWQNFSAHDIHWPDKQIFPFDFPGQIAKFDLVLLLNRAAEGLEITWEYNCDLFRAETIERWANEYRELLRHLAKQPTTALAHIPVMSEQLQKVVSAFNPDNREAQYSETTLAELFEKQAQQAPGATAVLFEDQQLSYQEIDHKANQVAQALLAKGVEPGDYVAVILPRGVEMIFCLYGILKVGASYVPLEPTFPAERITWIFHSLAIQAAVVGPELGELLARLQQHHPSLQVFCPYLAQPSDHYPSETMWAEEIFHFSGQTKPEIAVAADDVAYVIFTSGSTGRPKGVVVQHRPVVKVIEWVNRTFQVGAHDRLLFVTSLCFDLSVYDIFGILAAGGQVRIASSTEVQSPEELTKILEQQQITFWDSAPAALQQLVPLWKERASTQMSLRLVFLSGDWIPLTLPDNIRNHFPQAEVISLGGATEATIWSNFYRIGKVEPEWSSIPYGYPLPHARYYILDEYLRPCAIGVAGDLFIGGKCQALGYAQAPMLTASKFVPDPFTGQPGARMCATGDRARHWPDGTIEFLGRLDSQVKIRGYRIELEEIATVLQEHPAIAEVIVLAPEVRSRERRLVVYYIAHPGYQDVTTAQLRTFLRNKLPEYMVPSLFIPLESFPVTANGKVDYHKLANIVPDITNEEQAPQGEQEQAMAHIWQDLLALPKIGRKDNFFELGGDSLLSIRLLAKLQERGFAVTTRDIFQHPTVAELTAELATRSEQRTSDDTQTTSSSREASLLSSGQLRLWLVSQIEEQTFAYNLLLVTRITGKLDLSLLQQAFEEVSQRQAVLRAFVSDQEQQPQLKIAADMELPWQELTLSDGNWDALVQQEYAHNFDLTQAPLWRVKVVKKSPQEHLLLWNIHHLISDAWSMELLLQELVEIYQAKQQQRPSALVPLPWSYLDYAQRQRQWVTSEEAKRQKNYWKQQLAALPPLALATDFPRQAGQSFHGEKARVVLSSEVSQKIREFTRNHQATLFMTLMSAWQMLLQRYSGQQDIAVGFPVSNRQEREWENLAGLFLNLLVLRTEVMPEQSFDQLLQQVKQTTLDAYSHQQFPFEQLVKELQPQRDLSRTPLFQVMFNWLGRPTESLEMDDLHLEILTDLRPAAKFDLTLYAWESGENIVLQLVFNGDLFAQQTGERYLNHLAKLLAKVVYSPEQPLAEISVVPAQQRSKEILAKPIATRHYPNVTELFHRQSQQTPEQLAVCQGNSHWNYRQLAMASQQVTASLYAQGVQPGEVVAIRGKASLELVASIIGVLQSGAVLLTIAEDLPGYRQQLMLEQAQAKYLLEWQAQDMVPASVLPSVLRLSPPDWHQSPPADFTLPTLAGNAPAYIFFTSGTTGIPKAILGQQQGLGHFLAWQSKQFQITAADRGALLTGLSFDMVLRDIFLPLTNGASLVLPAQDQSLHSAEFLAWLAKEPLSFLHLVPSVAQNWLQHPDFALTSLRWTFFAGEPLQEELIAAWRKRTSGEIVNFYGATETTLIKAFYQIPPQPQAGAQPVGQPLPETQLLVLHPSGEICAPGEVGEVAIRTPYRTLGYLNNPEQTQKRFRLHPYSSDPNDLLYYTGDRGRYLAGGDLEILGRLDDQIKIHGVRVELAEVAACVQKHTGVASCVVLFSPQHQQLVAYVVAQAHLEIAILRSFLQTRLPAYMIPAHFVVVESFPLTPNGKVDRAALLALAIESQSKYVAPRNHSEEQLVKIWQEVLAKEKIGIHDNFFELGGHSLNITQVATRIAEVFQVQVPLRKLFEFPTIAEIAKQLLQSHLEQTKEDKLAALLAQVEDLPEEEVLKLLEEESNEN